MARINISYTRSGETPSFKKSEWIIQAIMFLQLRSSKGHISGQRIIREELVMWWVTGQKGKYLAVS